VLRAATRQAGDVFEAQPRFEDREDDG